MNISISTLIANSVHISQEIIYNIALGFRNLSRALKLFVILVIAACLVIVFNFAQNYREKRDRFIATIDSGIAEKDSQFKSANNNVFNILPEIAASTRPQNWDAFQNLYRNSARSIEDSYKRAADCIRSQECAAGSNASAQCRRILRLNRAFRLIEIKLSDWNKGRGIIVNKTGDPAQNLLPGTVITVPMMPNLQVLAQACE